MLAPINDKLKLAIAILKRGNEIRGFQLSKSFANEKRKNLF
jgi:hypothetical protein